MVDRRRLGGDARLRARELLDDPNGRVRVVKTGWFEWCKQREKKRSRWTSFLAGRDRSADSDLLREGSRWRPAFIAAAACNEMDADRGDPVGDSERGTEETSPLAAIAGRFKSIR